MTISLTNLDDNLWNIMYNHLQTGTYAISTDNIHGAMNDVQIDSEGYPQVIILTPKYELSKITMDGKHTQLDVNFNVQVFHTNGENIKLLFGEIVGKILSGESVFLAEGLSQMKIISGTHDYYTTGNKKIHYMTKDFNFVLRLVKT